MFNPPDFKTAKETFRPLKRTRLNRSPAKIALKRAAKAERLSTQGEGNPTKHGLTGLKCGGNKRGFRPKSDPEMRKWTQTVLKRDNYECQWPLGCHTGDTRIDAHHRYKRSQRPDLKYNVRYGIALCRKHHHRTDTHRAEAVELGMILTETYELAHK